MGRTRPQSLPLPTPIRVVVCDGCRRLKACAPIEHGQICIACVLVALARFLEHGHPKVHETSLEVDAAGADAVPGFLVLR